MEKIVETCAEILRRHYGRRLVKIVHYGSTAQRAETDQSDVDLLVVLEPPLDYFAELDTIVELLRPVQWESDRLISAKPAPRDEYEAGRLALYRNILQHGAAV